MASELGLGSSYFGQVPVAKADPRAWELNMETAAPWAEGPGNLPSKMESIVL